MSAADENNDKSRKNATITYNFSIQHSTNVENDFVLESIKSSAYLYLHSVLNQSDNLIQGLDGAEGSIELKDIQSTSLRSLSENNEEKSRSCGEALDDHTTCTLLNLATIFSYPTTITEEDVRFHMLLHYDEMTTIMSNSIITVKYKGRTPSNTTTLFYVSSGGEVKLDIYQKGTLSYLEDAIKVFLNNMFALSSVKIRRVRVLHQQVQNHERHLSLRSSNNHHSRDSISTLIQHPRQIQENNRHLSNVLEIKTSILAEYTPPPFLDLGELIDEIYKESGHYFMEGIQENKVLGDIKTVHTKSHSQHVLPNLQDSALIQTGTGNSIFYVKEFSIPFFVMLSFIIIFLIVFVVNLITKKKAVVKVLGMEELMDRRESTKSIINGNSMDGALSESKGQKSYKSLQLKSDERVYSVTNLQ